MASLCCCWQYDEFFPQFRAFDWFSGHSWARGLLFAFDGKDQVRRVLCLSFSVWRRKLRRTCFLEPADVETRYSVENQCRTPSQHPT